MTAVPIRQARPEDRTAIETIQAATLADPTPSLLDPALTGLFPALVATDHSDTPVGYALVLSGEETAYLAELAVVPARQGEGIGSALLAAVVDRLDGTATSLRLTARATDDRVRTFYENRGFTAVDRVPDHYVDGVDGIVYERALD